MFPLPLEEVGYNSEADGSILHFALIGMAIRATTGVEIVRQLLESRLADESFLKTNKKGETPLLLAVKLKCPTKIFKEILKKSSKMIIDRGDRFGSSPLHYAVFTHSVEKTKLLLNKAANVDVKTNYRTILVVKHRFM